MPIGDKIRELRKAHGFNQTELGKRLGVKTNAVSKWECGRVEDIPMSKVKAMAVLFNVPISYLIDDERSDVPQNQRKDGVVRCVITDEMDVAFYGDYRELSDADREILHEMARVMRNRQLDIKRKPSEETT